MTATSELTTVCNVDSTGAIDCDGHVLEPIEALRDHLEEKYKERAIKIEVEDDGLEYLYYDNKKSKLTPGGFTGVLGAMGDLDHTDDYIDALKGLIAPLSEETQRKIMYENVTKVYNL